MHKFRDLQAFRNDGLQFSTSSDTAVKMFDALTDQLVKLYENTEVGGIGGTFAKMFESDANCVIGKAAKLLLETLGSNSTISKDASLQAKAAELYDAARADGSTITPLEKRYVYAAYAVAKGFPYLAYKHLEAVLRDYPSDAFAMRLTHDMLHQLGRWDEMRDLSARLYKHWQSRRSDAYYPNLLGMYAFSLEESKRYEQAEQVAREGLLIEPSEQWCIHSVAHVKDMQGSLQDGLSMLEESESQWNKPQKWISNHLRWHTAVFTFDAGKYDSALDIYDMYIRPKVLAPTRSTLDIIDGASLLYRLQLVGHEVGDRWIEFGEICSKYAADHVRLYRDIHFAMCFAGAGRQEDMSTFLSSLDEYIDTERSTLHFDEELRGDLLDECNTLFVKNNMLLYEQIGRTCFEAISAYASADYDACFELLYPIRYKLQYKLEFGGSYTQRDVLMQLLLHACLKSNTYASYARPLLLERQAERPSPFNERYLASLATRQLDD